jgi:hypothetical protein
MTGRRMIAPVLFAAAFVAAACLLRLPGFDMPLNRDESTYAMIGDQGSLRMLPYRDFFDNKQPLIYGVYWAIARVAPQTTGAVRLTAALCAGVAVLLLALLAPRIGRARALAAAAIALVAGATTYVEGYDLNAEHVLIVPGTATILAALHFGASPNRRVPLLVGLLGGVALLTKAVFAFSALAALVPLLAGSRDRQFAVGELLRQRARPGDRLFVAGAEPGFNWVSRLPPASPYFFLYGYPDVDPKWMPGIRRDVCDRPPRFLIVVWGGLAPGCAPPGHYRELLADDVPGGRLVVMELAQPR